ncbi:uncharacterized protein LOC132746965 [Ruditapes philippinarum]|uniref:uncharacterized protein LOC132746965 n=1 Tax=Ruditapes philippinarum TaxID=129788 RepID=UPI00295ADA5A|nr:uncharacterized protein LOC132746965 [Ruditapes philippinarum]
MYTVVNRPEVEEHERQPGEPLPLIIDHRKGDKWKNRHRKEQLPYDTLKKHRDTLLESEIKYKKTIRELEKERDELVATYETAYQENKQLKSILEHGPDAAKLKQLNKDKKEQKGLIEKLQEENNELGERLKRLEKIEKLTDPGNIMLERNWKKALDKVRKMREEEEAIPTQGPFAGGKLFKKKRIAIDDAQVELDTYDLQLDSVQKETQILLNKVKQLKREKEQIDYSLIMGKGHVVRNAVVANAISEKLNRDLNKYAIRLEKLKLKHKSAKMYVEDVRVVLGHPIRRSFASLPIEVKYLEPVTPLKPDSANLNENEKKDDTPPKEKKVPWSLSTKLSPPENKKQPVPERDNWIPPKQFEKPGTYTKIHQKSGPPLDQKATQNVSLNSSDVNDSLDKGETVNLNFRDDMRIQKPRHRIKTSSQGSLIRTTKAQSMRDSWVKTKDASNKTGGPKTNNNNSAKRRNSSKTVDSNLRFDETNNRVQLTARTNKTFPNNRPVYRQRKPEVKDNETYDDVLESLKSQTYSVREQMDQNFASPEPIDFNGDGRNVHRGDMYTMGNTGIRDKNFLPVKFVM